MLIALVAICLLAVLSVLEKPEGVKRKRVVIYFLRALLCFPNFLGWI